MDNSYSELSEFLKMGSSSTIDISATEIESGEVSELELLKLTFKMSKLNLSDDEDLIVNKIDLEQLNLLSIENLISISLAVKSQGGNKRKTSTSDGKESKAKKCKVDEIGKGEVSGFDWQKFSSKTTRLNKDEERSRIALLVNQAIPFDLLRNEDLMPITLPIGSAVENRGEIKRKGVDGKESKSKEGIVCIKQSQQQQVKQKSSAEKVLKSTSRNVDKTKKAMPNRLALRTNISGRGEKLNELHREVVVRRNLTDEKLRKLKQLREIVTRRKETEKALGKLKEELKKQNTECLNLEPQNKSTCNSFVIGENCANISKKNERSMNEDRIGKRMRSEGDTVSSNAKRYSNPN